ncbi:MAG TPA: RDD family protein [Nitrososphaerales archaeon]|nr:RDD family protein [Nitrososphaerales archaeon]
MASESAFCSKCGKPLTPRATFCANCGASVSTQAAAPPQAALSGFDALMKESSAQTYWVKRLLAYVVDAIVVYVAVVILALLFTIPFLLAAGPAVFATVLAGTLSFVAGLVLVLYFTVAEAYAGATLGKRVFGLKVVAAGGKLPTLGEAILRNISKIYWLLLLLDVVVGLATVKKYTQKFSDRYAGTEVVETAGNTPR